jgi:hypothetical protein
VNIFELTLAGVGGHHGWNCRSEPSVIPRVGSPGFAFEAPGQGLVGRKVNALAEMIGGAAALPDRAMEERLVSAGLFEQLSQLRWGRNHFLPKSRFIPPWRETAADFMDSSFVAGLEAAVERSPRLSEQLQAAGQADLRSAMAARFQKDEAQNPGKLTCEVEMGEETVPTLKRFRELLDSAVRIAEINAEANPPQQPGDRVDELGP